MNTQLALRNNVEKTVCSTNKEIVTESKRLGYTLYGDIAMVLEGKGAAINAVADSVGSYFAKNSYLKAAQKYEENSSFFERNFKNNKLKLAQFQAEQEAKGEVIMFAVRTLANAGAYGGKCFLLSKERDKVNRYIWQLCCCYANAISGGNIDNYSAMKSYLLSVRNSLFPNKPQSVDMNFYDMSKIDQYINFEQKDLEGLAYILYQIYINRFKRETTSDYVKNQAIENLEDAFIYMGFCGNTGRFLKKLDSISELDEFSRTNVVINNVFEKMTISLPDLKPSDKAVRNMRTELEQYVPNEERQKAVKKGGKLVVETAATAGFIAGGIIMENPALIKAGVSSGLALLNDVGMKPEDKQIIGNILTSDIGMSTNEAKQCIESGQQKSLEMKSN